MELMNILAQDGNIKWSLNINSVTSQNTYKKEILSGLLIPVYNWKRLSIAC